MRITIDEIHGSVYIRLIDRDAGEPRMHELIPDVWLEYDRFGSLIAIELFASVDTGLEVELIMTNQPEPSG